MANLYDINQQLANFEFEIDPETGEIMNAIQWDELEMAFDAKCENIACFIKNLKSDIAELKAEEKALSERRKSKERKVEYFSQMLKDALNGRKFETARCAVSYRKSVACEIEDEAAFIKTMADTGLYEYLTYKEPTVNKTAVKDALKAGNAILGAALVERQNMIIK